MRRKSELPELLSPAGSFESLIAAVAGGADAVYVGGKSFGARAYAKNFDDDELVRAVRYCHLNGVKLYVTVNTLISDREMAELSDYAAKLYRIGVDAVICADLGAIAEIKRRVPHLPIHASTQMSVHNTAGATLAESFGCVRVVPARELDIKNIRLMVENSSVEIEIFLHGALCVCYSGQCLMSSLVGGRSGNLGECAQPCRLPYNNGKYPISLKDLSLASHIPEIIDSGVASLKIEGRMKSPSYVFKVTGIYRRLLDERRAATEREIAELEGIFSRDGFTDGYFVGNTRGNMTGVRRESDKERSREGEVDEFTLCKHAVRAEVKIKLGSPAEMTLTDGKKTVTALGAVPAPAINAPLSHEAVADRLSKMGNTLLSLDRRDIKIELDDGVNLSPSSLNSLRREAVEQFEDSSRDDGNIAPPYVPARKTEKPKKRKTAQFFDVELYNSLIKKNPNALSGFDVVFLPLPTVDLAYKTPNGVSIPPVIFDTEYPQIEKMLEKAKELGITHALVGNLGGIELARRFGMQCTADFRFNITNALTKAELIRLGINDVILSAELTLPMARDIGGGVITYGRIPLMLTERCFMRAISGCGMCSRVSLTDRTGAKFPMMREFDHRNIIFNSTHTYMGDKQRELASAGLYREHFIFSNESTDEAIRAIKAYEDGAPLKKDVRRVGRREKNG